MGHNKKRFITAYDGKIKRSRHKTKLDFYKNIPYDDFYISTLYYINSHRDLPHAVRSCPQCRHTLRVPLQENLQYKIDYNRIRDIIGELWESNLAENMKQYGYYFVFHREYCKKFNLFECIYFRPPHPHLQSFLCDKHKRVFDATEEYNSNWRRISHSPYKHSTKYSRKLEHRKYRRKNKRFVQNAKYDTNFEVDILPQKRGCLD